MVVVPRPLLFDVSGVSSVSTREDAGVLLSLEEVAACLEAQLLKSLLLIHRFFFDFVIVVGVQSGGGGACSLLVIEF